MSSSSTGNKKALVIAISEYDDYEPLEFCRKDGELTYNALIKAGFKIPKKRKIIGRVSHDKFENAVKEFFRGEHVKSNDTLVFYYSGHGAPSGDDDYYFITSETNRIKPDVDGYDYDNLIKLSKKCICNKIVKVIDCCYAGALGARTKGDDRAKALIGKKTIEKRLPVEGEGSYVIASSLSSQESKGRDDGSLSEFTFHVLNGLNGNAPEAVDKYGYVTPHTLGRYVHGRMKNLERDQTPINNTQGSGDIWLARFEQYAKDTEQDVIKFLAPSINSLKNVKSDSKKERENLLKLIMGLELTQSSYHNREVFSRLFDSLESKNDPESLINPKEGNKDWEFDEEQLLITNKTRWNGIPLETNQAFFPLGKFWCRFSGDSQKIKMVYHNFLDPVDAKLLVKKTTSQEFGNIILCQYIDKKNEGYYEILKFVNEDIVIGKTFLGAPPFGKELYTYSMARKYAIDFMSEEDHEQLVNYKRFLLHHPENAQIGTWKGEIIKNDKIGAIPPLVLSINRNNNRFVSKLFLENIKYSDSISPESANLVIQKNFKISKKSFKLINANLIVGKISIAKSELRKKIPEIGNYFNLGNQNIIELRYILKKVSKESQYIE